MNITQFTGLAMFALATAACVRAARIRSRGWWWWLAAAALACVLEVAFGLRHQLHGWTVTIIRPLGWYESRGPAQILLVMGLVLMLVFPARWVRRTWRSDRRAGLAAGACWIAISLFLIEAISLHAVDAVMYQHVGKLPVIGWAWTLLSAVIIVTALSAARR